MDVKAAARAKHASSQRGRARHSSHKLAPKAAPAAAQAPSSFSDDKQRIEQQAYRLPSNWDRYEEEEPLEVDARLSATTVKSKGANYGDLLVEKSTYQFPESVDARKRLIQLRAHHILDQSAKADDIWNLDGISNDEDMFFSLDLKFLERELAKVSISERLFIDPKFILTEKRDIEISHDDSINKAEDWDNGVSEFQDDVDIDEKLAEQSTAISSAAASSYPEEHMQHDNIDLRGTVELEIRNKDTPGVSGQLITASKEQSANWDMKADIVFEPETAEAELDALLDMLDGHTDKEHLESTAPVHTRTSLNQQKKSLRNDAVDVQKVGGAKQLRSSFIMGITDDILISAKELQKPLHLLNIEQHTRVQTAPYEHVSGIEKRGKDSESINQLVNPADDFDSWLDSL